MMDPLPDIIVVGAAIAAIVFSLGAVAMTVLRPRPGRYLPDERLTSFEMRLDTFERRMGRFEENGKETQHTVQNLRMTVVSLATKDSVNQVAIEVGKLAGEMRAATQAVGVTAHSVERIERFLMDAAAKSVVGADKGTKG